MDKYVTVQKAADMCRISFEHSWHLVTSGRWQSAKIHNYITRVLESDVLKFAEEKETRRKKTWEKNAAN